MKKTLVTFFMIFILGHVYCQVLNSSFNTNLNEQSVEIKIDKSVGKVFFTFIGPSDAYFAFGFGNSAMANTYAIILNTNTDEFSERLLGNHNSGEQLSNKLTKIENRVNQGIRTVKLSRNITIIGAASESFFDFSTLNKGSVLEIIYSQGSSKELNFHGSESFGFAQLVFSNVVSNLQVEQKAYDVFVYPNPITNEFKMRFGKPQSLITYEILDLEYEKILSGKVESSNELVIDLKNISQGIYFAKVNYSDGYHIEKIVKQ